VHTRSEREKYGDFGDRFLSGIVVDGASLSEKREAERKNKVYFGGFKPFDKTDQRSWMRQSVENGNMLELQDRQR